MVNGSSNAVAPLVGRSGDARSLGGGASHEASRGREKASCGCHKSGVTLAARIGGFGFSAGRPGSRRRGCDRRTRWRKRGLWHVRQGPLKGRSRLRRGLWWPDVMFHERVSSAEQVPAIEGGPRPRRWASAEVYVGEVILREDCRRRDGRVRPRWWRSAQALGSVAAGGGVQRLGNLQGDGRRGNARVHPSWRRSAPALLSSVAAGGGGSQRRCHRL